MSTAIIDHVQNNESTRHGRKESDEAKDSRDDSTELFSGPEYGSNAAIDDIHLFGSRIVELHKKLEHDENFLKDDNSNKYFIDGMKFRDIENLIKENLLSIVQILSKFPSKIKISHETLKILNEIDRVCHLISSHSFPRNLSLRIASLLFRCEVLAYTYELDSKEYFNRWKTILSTMEKIISFRSSDLYNPCLSSVITSLLIRMPKNMKETQTLRLNTIKAIFDLFLVKDNREVTPFKVWEVLSNAFEEAVVTGNSELECCQVLLNGFALSAPEVSREFPFDKIPHCVAASGVIWAINRRRVPAKCNAEVRKTVCLSLFHESLKIIHSINNQSMGHSYDYGILLALSKSMPYKYATEDTDIEAVLNVFTERLISTGLTVTGNSNPSLLFSSHSQHLFISIGRLLALASSVERIKSLSKLSDSVHSLSFATFAFKHSSSINGNAGNTAVDTWNHVETGFVLISDILAASHSLNSRLEVETWRMLLGILGYLREGSFQEVKRSAVLKMAARLEACGFDAVSASFTSIPSLRSMRSSTSTALLLEKKQPTLFSELDPRKVEESSFNFRLASLWHHTMLAERWVKSIGHRIREPLVHQVIPYLLELCKQSDYAELNETAQRAHRVMWILISHFHILLNAGASDREDSQALESPHSLRHRLACRYFDVVCRLEPNDNSLTALSSAIGLIFGGLGQLDSERALCLRCASALRSQCSEKLRGDPDLSSSSTQAYLLELFLVMRIASSSVLVQILADIKELAVEAKQLLSAKGSKTFGALLYSAIAVHCDVSRRRLLCVWYQGLLHSKL